MLDRPWFEQWPERLAQERQALDALGVRWEEDDALFVKGVYQVRVWTALDGEELELVATFPDLYPYFRFDVAAPHLELPRHQHPFSRGLCLIGRATANWIITETLADFVRDRVPLAIGVARTPDRDAVAHLEEQQGEPLTDYYGHAHQPDSVVVFDGAWKVDPEQVRGTLVFGFENAKADLVRVRVLEVKDEQGKSILTEAPEVQRLYPTRGSMPWIRVARPPRTVDAREFWSELLNLEPQLRTARWGNLDATHGMRLVGVLFEDEVGNRKQGDGWLFVAEVGPRPKPQKRPEYVFLRPARAGRDDLAARVPELGAMKSAVVAVFGLGCIGSPSAVEFARAGAADLRVLDCDEVDPGTTVRWIAGLPAYGWRKAQVVRDYIRLHYPYTDVSAAAHHRIGNVREDAGGESDQAIIGLMLDGASLVYDAAAEFGVQHLLSAVAADRRLPYVRIEASQGGWGGLVARIVPGRTQGCYYCLQQALMDGTIVPPPFDPDGSVQPTGCSDPTFTGANFDLANVALAGVRLAVSTLSSGSEEEYPDVEWDVAVLSLRGAGGSVIPPEWKTYQLDRHPNCPACAAARGMDS